MFMFFYGTLIVSLFVLLIVGAGWLLRKREKEHEEEMEQLRKETDLLRDKLNRLTARDMLNTR